MNREDFGKFSGSLDADIIEFIHDAMPKPDTLTIYMTRGERRIADELRKQFGGFERVIIDVDGQRHEFKADSLIRLLEGYEGAPGTRWHQLFGIPERAARTLYEAEGWTCSECPIRNQCKANWPYEPCPTNDYDSLLEWLRGDA